MAALADAKRETVFNLSAVRVLIAEWKKTPEHNHGTRARICVEMDALIPYRKEWSNLHKASYAYAISKALVRRKAGLNQWNGYKPPDWRSLSARIAEARTQLHEWCVSKKVGYLDEHNAGAELIRLMNGGTEQNEALETVKLSVPIGK